MNKDYTIEINETVNTFLNSLSDDELRSIINDSNQESRLEELVQKCAIVPKLKQEKEVLIAKNKSLADYNYKKEPTFSELRRALEEANKQTVENKQKLIEKQAKLNKLKPKITENTLRVLLQVAAQESEEQSEEIAKQFLSSEKPYEEFIKEYIKKRTEYHLRRLKYEKLIDSIQNEDLRLNSSKSSLIYQNKPPTSLDQTNSSNNLMHQQPIYPPSSLNHQPLPYPTNINAPAFAYQPFNQPIRSAPLPPVNLMELPPYSAPSVQFPPSTNSYIQQPKQPSYPFNLNPNYR